MAYRGLLLWVGAQPPVDLSRSCEDRELNFTPCAAADLADQWSKARTVAFSVAGPDDLLITSIRDSFLAQALSHGVRVYILTPLAQLPEVHRRFRGIKFFGGARLLDIGTASRLPEFSARQTPQRAFSVAVSLHGCSNCNPEDLILLHRAFEDCSEVHFTPLAGGYSALVFQALARLKASEVGPYPLPFFVKLDRYHKIRIETENYRSFTSQFVPFYARPNIDETRCLLGAERGIIVGDFVEQSESLAALVDRGAAQSAINSLFDDALRGWRTQAYLSQSNTVQASIARSLGGAMPSEWLRMASARIQSYTSLLQSLNVELSYQEIAKLLDDLPPISHRCALSHGDLHGENVRVRSGHSILIDFAAVRRGPLVADPAALDVALAMRASPANDSVWKGVVSELYSPVNLNVLPQLREPTAPLSNLWNSIRQIRRYGLAEEITDGEYATAVAISLLRYASRKRGKDESPLRRALPIYLAERLAKHLTNTH